MLGSGFRLYLAYEISGSTINPFAITTLTKTDGTNQDVTATAVGINDLIAGMADPLIPANSLKLADEIKDVTEAGSPNTINTTTRRVARQGVQSNEITTISRDLTVQLVYEPHTAFDTPTVGYEVLDVLEYCEITKEPIFAIDLDGALAADGTRAGCANYTVALSQPREVEGQVVYDLTMAVKNLYQRVQYEAAAVNLFKAIVEPD